MTDCIWTGAASNQKQIDTIVIALTWATNDTITLTIGGVDFTVTIGTLVTTAQVATTLKQAFNAETLTDTSASYNIAGGAISIPQFRDITASVSSSSVTFTQSTASYALFPGKPWTMTVTGDGTAGNGTATLTPTRAATSRYHADNNDNWSSTPAHGDRLIFQSGNVDCLYGLTLAIQPSEIIVTKGYRGKIGLAAINTDNQGYSYREYRTRHLTSGSNSASSTATIGLGDGQGSPRVNLSFAALQFAATVYGSGGREDNSVPSICLLGTHASNTLTNFGGDVGWAFLPTETGHLATVRNSGNNAKTVLGQGVDLGDATLTCSAGLLETNSLTSTSSSIAVTGGTLTINTGNQLAITVSDKGTVLLRNTGSTIATLTQYGGTVTKQTAGALTITNVLQIYRGATFSAPDGVTLTNGFKLNGCNFNDVTLDFGENHTYTISA